MDSTARPPPLSPTQPTTPASLTSPTTTIASQNDSTDDKSLPITRDLVAGRLATLRDSQDSIESVSQWFLFYRRAAPFLVGVWADTVRAVPDAERRLPLFYLANDVAQKSVRRGNYFAAPFTLAMPELVADTLLQCAPSQSLPQAPSQSSPLSSSSTAHGQKSPRERLTRLVKIWAERGVFTGAPMTAMLNAVNGDQPAAVEHQLLTAHAPLLDALHAVEAARAQAAADQQRPHWPASVSNLIATRRRLVVLLNSMLQAEHVEIERESALLATHARDFPDLATSLAASVAGSPTVVVVDPRRQHDGRSYSPPAENESGSELAWAELHGSLRSPPKRSATSPSANKEEKLARHQ